MLPPLLRKRCIKRCFKSRKPARKAKRLLQREYRVKLSIYYCSQCSSFHLTSIDPVISRTIYKHKNLLL